MATTTLTPTVLVKDTPSGNLAIAGGTAIVDADTVKIPFAEEDKLIIILNNTFAGAKTISFASGNPGFVASGLGKLDVSLLQDEVKYVMLSSERFKAQDGYIYMTFASGTTGYYRAIKL